MTNGVTHGFGALIGLVPDDDLFFVMTDDGRTGYFSSVRGGGHGDDDIYRVSYLPEPPAALVQPREHLAASRTGGAGHGCDDAVDHDQRPGSESGDQLDRGKIAGSLLRPVRDDGYEGREDRGKAEGVTDTIVHR